MTTPKPLMLCILDGWGESDVREHNAIAQAHTPHFDRLKANYPFGTLSASEGDVGLPVGQMGNSEVGHMNIGAGRVVMQDLPRIDSAIADGSLAQNAALVNYIAALKNSGGTCHLLGLLSDGGVHAHQAHMAALAIIVASQGVPVAVHAFIDGRDTSPKSALGYIEQFEAATKGHSNIRFATISGRYYAMDRDNRWERVGKAYDAMVEGNGEAAPSATDAVNLAYAANLTDEFALPTTIKNYGGMVDGDGILMTNFRADRARQLLHALLDPFFNGFPRPRRLTFAATLGMVEYSEALNTFIPALFAPQTLANNLGEIVSRAGLTQLRIAETEKYAHVTFFFNGGREEPFVGESRILVPSPKVATYDLQPEMSAGEVTDKLVEAIASNAFDLIVVNYANTDMVGHSGDITAAMKAVEAVDAALGRLADAIGKAGGAMLITADHGNAECLHDEDAGQPHTAHTLNLVPCILVGEAFTSGPKDLGTGVLADIAPTLVGILGLEQPAEMTGRDLLAHAHARSLIAAFLLMGQAHAEAPQAQLDSTLQTLAKTKETEAQLKKQLEDSSRDLSKMRERATGLAERLQVSERRVSSQESELEKVNADLAAKQKEFDARKADYAATVVSLLRMRELPPTAVFSSGGDAQQVMRTASLLEKTNEAVANKAARLRTDMATLKKLQTNAALRDAATRAEKANLKTEQEALARELVARQKLQNKLSADHANATAQVAKLSRESQSLQELIGKLAANEKANAKTATGPKPAPIRNFDGKKGSARAPVAGDVIHRFGERLNANSTYHGMVFKARANATVVSPYDGEVVFTGPFRDYGNMVLIKHKNGYISLIAGLGKVDTGLNQTASRGEPIGTMPASGNGEAYVELRDADAKPIDPSEWFANVGGKLAQ